VVEKDAAPHEHHHARSSKVQVPEQAEVEDRFSDSQLPYDKEDETDDRYYRERDYKVRSEPVVFLAFVEYDLQESNPDGKEPETT